MSLTCSTLYRVVPNETPAIPLCSGAANTLAVPSIGSYLMKRQNVTASATIWKPCSTLYRVVPNETMDAHCPQTLSRACSTLYRVVPNETLPEETQIAIIGNLQYPLSGRT